MVIPVLLAMFAVWRLSRLVATDFLTQPLRDRVIGWDEKKQIERHPKLGYLVSCSWCISIWIAPPMMAVALYWPTNRIVLLGFTSLAASGLAGMMATVEDRLDR